MSCVNLYDSSYRALKDVEWDFRNAQVDELESIHPYPARFISEVPKNLISILGCKNQKTVFDPFCGSGTTLVEASRAGYQSIGVDLNPIACLISRVKINPLAADYLTYAQDVTQNAQAKRSEEIIIPEMPNLDHWFKKDIQRAIASLCDEINKSENINHRDALQLALSSIIVKVSNQESDTRYAAIDNSYTSEDVFQNFYRACKKIYHAKQKELPYQKATIIENDILKVTPSKIGNDIGLVITSPPYPNAYEYWLYHKYRMWWLGFDPIAVRTNEIGARPHYQKKNGQTEEDFKGQMKQVFSLITNVLVKNGHICFVVGRSVIKGKVVDNAKIINEIAEENNLAMIANIRREIAPTKKSFNLKYGKIKTENIVIFRKDF